MATRTYTIDFQTNKIRKAKIEHHYRQLSEKQMRDWLDFIWALKDTNEFQHHIQSRYYQRMLFQRWKSTIHRCCISQQESLMEMSFFLDYLSGSDSFHGFDLPMVGVELIG